MGGFEGQGQTCELWSVGVCSLRGISFSYRFPFIREQEYVWAEILINPRSAADQSAAAPGLLSKGAAEFGHNPSLQAGAQDCLHPFYPLLPYRRAGSRGSLAPGSTLQEHSSPFPCRVPMPRGAPFGMEQDGRAPSPELWGTHRQKEAPGEYFWSVGKVLPG